jgi:hypothetical protein
LIDTSAWRRLESVANLMEEVCSILDRSENPKLPLSESIALF